jgi:hypothetical protein
MGFILGLRNTNASRPLMAYGLNLEQLAVAHQLLRDATQLVLNQPKEDTSVNPALLERLDKIDNHWFPIIKYALVRHDPEIADWVFLNLHQSQGLELILSMSTLFERVRALGDGTSPFGEAGKEAFAVLRERNLTDEVFEQVDGLFAEVQQFETTQGFGQVAYEEAVNKLWGWYLEWGGIARTVISDRRVLRSLGFLRTKGSSAPTPDEEGDGEDEDDTQVGLVLPGVTTNHAPALNGASTRAALPAE